MIWEYKKSARRVPYIKNISGEYPLKHCANNVLRTPLLGIYSNNNFNNNFLLASEVSATAELAHEYDRTS